LRIVATGKEGPEFVELSILVVFQEQVEAHGICVVAKDIFQSLQAHQL
jgi:hypothetical protein